MDLANKWLKHVTGLAPDRAVQGAYDNDHLFLA